MRDGLIMITWANHHYLDFAKSWVFHIRKVRARRGGAGRRTGR